MEQQIDTRFRDFTTRVLEQIIVDGFETLRLESHLRGAITEMDQRIQKGTAPPIYDRWITSQLAMVKVGGQS